MIYDVPRVQPETGWVRPWERRLATPNTPINPASSKAQLAGSGTVGGINQGGAVDCTLMLKAPNIPEVAKVCKVPSSSIAVRSGKFGF